MKCANCAKDNPAGARYCIHCGAEQTLPTPIAAVAAAAMASGRRSPLRQAANAAQAEPITDHSVAQESEPARWQPQTTSGSVAVDPRTTASPAGDVHPAYAMSPRRTGLAVALVAACVVVAAIAFTAIRFVQPDAPTTRDATRDAVDSVMSAFPPDATPPSARRAPTDVAASSQAATDSGAARSNSTTAPSASTAAVPREDTAKEVPPVEIRPLPARPAPRTTRRVVPEKVAEPPAAPLAPAPVVPGPPVVAAAPKASAALAPDPWPRMREELSRCTREDFITRVICDQRVRFRFCKDYWGKVPECPGTTPADHGQ